MNCNDKIQLLLTALALGIVRFEQSKTCPALIEVCYRGMRHCVEYSRQREDDDRKVMDSFYFLNGLNYRQLKSDIIAKMNELGI